MTPSHSQALSRRNFLKAGAAASSLMILPNWAIGQSPSANEKLNVAIIGSGGRGNTAVKNVVDAGHNLLAFCDVDEKRAAETFQNYPDVPRFKDFRVLFDKLENQIDAVTVSTPDHMHYPIALWAVAMGKPVFCEKPLVRTIAEARALQQAAKKAGVITQMGNQGHAGDGIRTIREWMDAGVVGEVVEVLHWSNRPIWPQGELNWEPAEVPAHVDYNLWLGVAPERPFTTRLVPFAWRGYRDFGCGAIGDMACHIMDASFTGLGLGLPKHIAATSTPYSDIAFPESSTIEFVFPRPGHKDVKVTWMDGGKRPTDVPFVDHEFIHGIPGDEQRKGEGNGTLIVGTKGTVFTNTYCNAPRLFPSEHYVALARAGELPEKTLPRVGGHFEEWFEGIKTKTQPGANFDYAAAFTEAALLGNVAVFAGEPIDYDSENMRVTNVPEANRLLHSQYDYRAEFLPQGV